MTEPAPLFIKLYCLSAVHSVKNALWWRREAWQSNVHVQFGELIGPGMAGTDPECSQFWDLQLNLLMGKGFILAFKTNSCLRLKSQLKYHIVWEAFSNVPRYHWLCPHHPGLYNTSVTAMVLNLGVVLPLRGHTTNVWRHFWRVWLEVATSI